MKKVKVLLAVVLLASAGYGHAGLLQFLSRKTATWSFLQTCGGIAIGKVLQKDGREYLEVDCDVGGTREITRAPSMINSGLMVHRLTAKEEKGAVVVTVKYGLVGKGYPTAPYACRLPKLKPGVYTVYYGDAGVASQKLGEIVVGTADDI